MTVYTPQGEFTDICYETTGDGIARITICRPEVRNAFRPRTVIEMREALQMARMDGSVGVVILRGEGELAFCSGGDQKVRGDDGYGDEDGHTGLHVLDFQREIRTCPQAGDCFGRGVRHWGRPRAAHAVRPDHLLGQRTLWPDRSQGRFVRRGMGRVLHGPHHWPKAGP